MNSDIPGRQNKKPMLERNFSYHAPKDDRLGKYEQIKNKAQQLAFLIDDLCPESREKSLSTTKLEEAFMWANAAIARNE
jgi:hypothetical protein